MSLKAAMLRGINLGKRTVVMSELRAICEGAGFSDVRTLLASGNLVLRSRLTSKKLEAKLEDLLGAELGFKTDVFVRDGAELAETMAANPFADFARASPSFLLVMFLRTAPSAAEKKAIEKPQDGPERAKVVGREIFVAYPNGQGQSRFRVDAYGTGRNWNTVSKLAAMTRGD